MRPWCYLEDSVQRYGVTGAVWGGHWGTLTTGGLEVDPVAVENKGAVRGVDADSHRPVFKQRHLQGLCISRCDVGVALDTCGELGRVHVAKAILVREGSDI